MIVDTPEDTPDTTPVEASIVATEGLPLVHTPPATPSISVAVEPAHTIESPEISPMVDVLTDTVLDAEQPVGKVYLMVVVPVETPPTTPVAAPTVAIDVARLLQTPPEVASERVIVEPEQTEPEPTMAAGAGFTVTLAVTKLTPSL